MIKKIIFTIFVLSTILLISSCGRTNQINETDNHYENNLVSESNDLNNEPVTEIESFVMVVETLGNVHWDGTEIAVSALGLQPGNIYKFTVNVSIPNAFGGIGLVLQGNEPGWIEIASTDDIVDNSWHELRGVLDLSGVSTIDFTHIQIVKNQHFERESENIIFLVKDFEVRIDEEILFSHDFATQRFTPFTDRGHSLLSTINFLNIEELYIAQNEWDLTLPSLAEIYRDYFYFGNILEPALILNNPNNVLEMFLQQYNALTAENAMKPDSISGGSSQTTKPTNLNLEAAMLMADFATENNLFMVGHTLIWHEQSSEWLYKNSESGEFLTRAEAMENMRWFIEQYAGALNNQIDAWDVANEVFTNNGSGNNPNQGPIDSPVYSAGHWQRALRNYAPWYHAFSNNADFEAGERGWDYIYYAYVFARRYAPNAILIYNDFNEEQPAKRDAIASMVEEFNHRWQNDAQNNPAYNNPNHEEYNRLLIEAIGMQSHYNQSTSLHNVSAAIERFVQTGARIHITELDIQFTNLSTAFEMNEAQLNLQADMFAQLFMMYIEFSDYIDRVSIWGREDGSSWRGANGATHFDRHLQPKPAFWAIADPVNWLTERGLLQ